ncbi:MAG TPA: hypothetical protein V6D47_10175 [Oscillatoriaceae cyanobacterium]
MITKPLTRPTKPSETGALDPVVERAWFLAELDQLELTLTIPRAEPEPRRS